MNINLIGVRGRIGAGKDEVARIIQYLTTPTKEISYGKGYNSFVMDVGMGFKPTWDVKKFAGKLKQIASLLTGIPVEKFEDQEFKKTYLGDEWDTYRGTKSINGKVKHFVFSSKKEGSNAVELERLDSFYMNKMIVRELLQKIGTEALRKGLHTNVWVNALFSDFRPRETYKMMIADYSKPNEDWKQQGVAYEVYPKWIISDVRFPNEQEAIKERDGIVVRVNRALVQTEGNLHESETALDNHQPDWELDNNSDIPSLIEEVRKMLLHFNIQQ